MLIFVIDADTKSIRERLSEFEESLQKARLPERKTDEKIAIFVPKRNIETWVHFAQGEPVNEMKVYSKLDKERDCKPAVKNLKENICTKELPSNTPSSLFAACEELKRIL